MIERTEIFEFLNSIIPTILLLIGGQYILNKYDLLKKREESFIELRKSIKEEQYSSLTMLYEIFGDYMAAFRLINLPADCVVKDKKEILAKVIELETNLEGLILKICNEFVDKSDNLQNIEIMLGNLRQSVQIWRESLVNNNNLPFNISHQEDYVRFKTAFSKTSAFMSSKINLDEPIIQLNVEESEKLLFNIFDKSHEKWKKGHFYTGG